jgi:hypothetical protein
MRNEKEIEDMPSLYFNEYFKRKPDRLSERENYNLFTMKPSNSNCVEYVFADPLRQEIQRLNQKIAELKETVCRCDGSVGFICNACHDQKYFHKYEQAVKDLQMFIRETLGGAGDTYLETLGNRLKLKHGISEE